MNNSLISLPDIKSSLGKTQTEINRKNGEKFEEFCAEIIKQKEGIIVHPHRTKESQLLGENDEGFEMKYDRVSLKTTNLYIEYAEKNDPKNLYWVCSGILRNDNTKIYYIGNYNEIYRIPKSVLLEFYKNAKELGLTFKKKPTSKAFLLPKSMVQDYLYWTKLENS